MLLLQLPMARWGPFSVWWTEAVSVPKHERPCSADPLPRVPVPPVSVTPGRRATSAHKPQCLQLQKGKEGPSTAGLLWDVTKSTNRSVPDVSSLGWSHGPVTRLWATRQEHMSLDEISKEVA